MTTILGLCLLAAGLLMLVGASGSARKLAYGVLGTLLILALARCLFCQLRFRLPSIGAGGWYWLLLVGAAVGGGWLAWKTKPYRHAALAERRRRDMHPRQPAPIASPNPSAEEEERLP
jgi:hypothetical protein